MRVERLPPSIIEQFVDGGADFPVIVYGGFDADGAVQAMGGLSWIDGRCMAWFEVFSDISGKSLTMFRWAKRMLRMAGQMGETEVYVFRDEWHASSAKLIGMLGFEMVGVMVTDGMEAGKEIFACRV